MERDVLVGLTVIVAFGVGGQWLAVRLRVPSILVLLLAGFIAGPVTGLADPEAIFAAPVPCGLARRRPPAL